LVILSKSPSTKSKTLLAEPFGQRLLVISTTLSTSHVGWLQIKASALHKYPATRCKNQLERSTRPNSLRAR
ncbi:hypothetical protein, partial [Vibrio atlanticus]|uniref:hypothetical protein n=1 Tax=Vibrio atlanticus TaxID=693153 RepID=UPI00354CB871